MSAAIATNVVPISTRTDYARRIRERLVDAVEAVLEVGEMLITAKTELAHGEFTSMVREDLGWSPRTAQRFMAIARHPTLSKATNASLLPPSWTTLAELARVPAKRLEEAIENGLIKPDMSKSAINEVVYQYVNQQKRVERADPDKSWTVVEVVPPSPWEELRGIAMSTGELFAQLETLHGCAVETLCRLPLAAEDRPYSDALDALANALEEARDSIGDLYDDLAGMTNLPTREQA